MSTTPNSVPSSTSLPVVDMGTTPLGQTNNQSTPGTGNTYNTGNTNEDLNTNKQSSKGGSCSAKLFGGRRRKSASKSRKGGARKSRANRRKSVKKGGKKH